MNEVFRPGQSVTGRQRYTDISFPPYSYVPGFSPHPSRNSESDRREGSLDSPPPMNADRWQDSQTYLYALDLYNHGYYWEAHEAWESLWIAAGRQGRTADWLKGLIKLAAAAVKHREGNAVGVQRHSKRAIELLANVCPIGKAYAGLSADRIRRFLHDQCNTASPLPADPTRLLPLVLLTIEDH